MNGAVGRPRRSTDETAGLGLGRFLSGQREAAGLTRAAAARRAGISVNTLQAIEQGRSLDPGFFKVAALCAALDTDVAQALRAAESPLPGAGLVSVGYEGRSVQEMAEQLRLAGVTRLADVRLNAISRRRGFSKTALSQELAREGIEYVHLRGLGNPKDNRAGFATGDPGCRQAYRELLLEPTAHALVRDLAAEARARSVAVLCVEREEQCCHRALVLEAVRRVDPQLAVSAV